MATIVVVVALGLFLVGQIRISPPTPTIRVTLGSASYQPFVDPDLPDGGPVGRVVMEAFRRQGIEPTLTFTSFEVAQQRTSNGEVLGSFPFIGSETRRAQFLVSDPIMEFDYVLFFSVSAWSGTGPDVTDESIGEFRVGKVRGYDVWTELDDAVAEFVEFDSSAEAFTALAAGDIDLLPEGLVPGQRFIGGSDTTFDSSDFAVVESSAGELVRSTETLHLLMRDSGANSRAMERFNAGLAAVRTTPLYTDLLDAAGATSALSEVVLAGAAGKPAVAVYRSESGAEGNFAPLGTRAVVLEWPPLFVPGFDGDVSVPPGVRVEVKVLDGPSAGSVGWVDVGDLRLLGGDR